MQLTLEQMKQQAACAAAAYVQQHASADAVIGVGTGSTANYFIDALAAFKMHERRTVSSSLASTARLQLRGMTVITLDQVSDLPFYVDGADEINPAGFMIKGGGGALTGEKIIAAAAQIMICIADASKQVQCLGNFPLPIEVVPMACATIARRLMNLGGCPTLRAITTEIPYLTEYGHYILDTTGLALHDPIALEIEINAWPGVVTVGLFACRGADLCWLGTQQGVKQLDYQTTRLPLRHV